MEDLHLSDLGEPYRELVYGGVEVPWIPDFYRNTIVGYSFSKSLSLPGERIGYLVLPSEMDDSEAVKNAANVATGSLAMSMRPLFSRESSHGAWKKKRILLTMTETGRLCMRV